MYLTYKATSSLAVCSDPEIKGLEIAGRRFQEACFLCATETKWVVMLYTFTRAQNKAFMTMRLNLNLIVAERGSVLSSRNKRE